MQFTLTPEEQAAFDRAGIDPAAVLQGKVIEMMLLDSKNRRDALAAQLVKYSEVAEVKNAITKMQTLEKP